MNCASSHLLLSAIAYSLFPAPHGRPPGAFWLLPAAYIEKFPDDAGDGRSGDLMLFEVCGFSPGKSLKRRRPAKNAGLRYPRKNCGDSSAPEGRGPQNDIWLGCCSRSAPPCFLLRLVYSPFPVPGSRQSPRSSPKGDKIISRR
jgi:hypothetical protein